MTTLLAFLFVLGVLVFIHELGHFLLARWNGVRVLTFSLGFGPKILTVKRGDTEYCISAIPLGGYVKMAGENPEDNRTGAADEFLSKTKWQRFQVLVMGPVMNMALALLVMTLVLYQGAPVPAYETQPVVIGSFDDRSPARDAGLQVGEPGAGVIIGSGGGGIDVGEQQYHDFFVERGRRVTPYAIPVSIVGMMSSEISISLRLRGISHVLSCGCTSSTDAIAYAAALIRSGEAETLVAGGADACVTPGMMFGRMTSRIVWRIEAPRLREACSSRRSKPASEVETVITT